MHKSQSNQGWRYAIVLASVSALTAVLLVLREVLGPSNLVLFYVPLVLLVAIRFGRTAAGLAAGASFLAYNFFFVPPLYTLTVEQPQDIAELGIFLVIALLAGTLAARERSLKFAAIHRADQMAALYTLSQEVSTVRSEADLLPTIAATAQRVLNVNGVEICLREDTAHATVSIHAGTCRGAPSLSVPIRSGTENIGTVRLYNDPRTLTMDTETSTFLTTITTHIALAVSRSRAAAVAMETRSLREADRLKSALLSSVSHDLRTPLAAIKGAASNLCDPSVHWDRATQYGFATTIVEEADRLNRFVRNMLEMSRLEGATAQRPHMLIDVGDVLASTLQRLKPLLTTHQLHIDIAPDLPWVSMDAVQIELVVSNLLENAAKFASPQTPITITAHQTESDVVVSVADRGPGIPPDELHRIFVKFYRLAGPEQGPGGTGLGLAICQAIVEVHGGHIWATNCPEGGAVFSFTLPLHASALANTPLAEQAV
jgi:two-component system, OmpR family, sensor histidine kinase KdpD